MKGIAVISMLMTLFLSSAWGGNNVIGGFNEFLEINKLDKKRVKKPKFIHVQRDDPNNVLRYGRASIEVKYDGKVCLITLILSIINIILPIIEATIFLVLMFVFDYYFFWIICGELIFAAVVGLITCYYQFKLNKQNKQNKK